MRKKTLLILFVILCNALFASDKKKIEMPPTAAFEDASNRITLFVKFTEDPKVMVQLKKNPKDLITYRSDFEQVNDALKAVVEKYWKFTEKYEFHTFAEVKKMTAGKNASKYLIFQYLQKTADGQPLPADQFSKAELPFLKISNEELWGCYELKLAEHILPEKPVLFSFRTNYFIPSNFNEVFFTLQAMQYELNNLKQGLSVEEIETNIKANAKMLKHKTLMIDQKDIDVERFGEQIDKEFYPYESEITVPDSMYSKLIAANPDYAYVRIFPKNENELVHYITVCEDGVMCNVVVSKIKPKQKRKQRITEEVLLSYARKGKLKSKK